VNEQAERLASNQTLFRAVNEKMLGLNDAFASQEETAGVVCECSHLDCFEQIDITPAAYAAVHENPRRFVVVPSGEHVYPDIERIVTCTEQYFVVEKVDVAGEVAEQAAGR
jgi:hypothetical protein